jgi:predicted nucleic acid-binding protein
MPRAIKIYLDTSVLNAYLDDRDTSRMEITKEFWNRLDQYEVFISDVVIEEIKETPDPTRRNNLLELAKDFVRLSGESGEIDSLAREYVMRGIIPAKYIEDALHIAIASANSIDVLVSWNFAHIVKLKTKREVNVVNIFLGYSQLELVEPSML